MIFLSRKAIQTTLLIVVSLVIFGCTDKQSNTDISQQAVAIESTDECHVCGMLVTRFPGPKGELYLRNEPQIKKFCSTRELFAFLLDPENKHRLTQAFVHDMAVSPWGKPNDEALIDAQSAWYVAGHNQKGAMGPTLASFLKQSDADNFSKRFGGRVIGFDQITLELLSEGNNPSQRHSF